MPVVVAAALRGALDKAARSLQPLGLSLDGRPAAWAPSESSMEWAVRADRVFETLALLWTRIKPYTATSGDAVAAALRGALDDAARSLQQLGLSLDSSRAVWEPSESSMEWAVRADRVFETLAALTVRIEAYAARPADAVAAALRADADRSEAKQRALFTGNERGDGADEVGSGGVPPADRLAYLAHTEHPVQMYAIMKPVPNTMPVPDDADEWAAAFGPVITGGNLPGGNGKTSTRTTTADTDPPEPAATPPGGPGLDLCRTCFAPADKPSAQCTNPTNHQAEQA
ncbi:hypothetical protein ACFVHW_04105 [Streptomyces sp. NPDC127110]|uniref:hypothetical protein n=1 Tax=Streptomyces sp. NPDC127110 TaxID=3345362 RepID=UPI00363EDBB3